jgi:copper(I)-binding protein
MQYKSPMILVAILAASVTPLASAAAQSNTGASVTVPEAWARASAGSASMSAAYVVLKGGAQDDALTGASTPAAHMAEVHETIDDKGVMKMRKLPSVAVPANGTVTFAPGGNHIMLMGLAHPLAGGDTFPLTLTFAHSAPITVTVTVRALGSGGDKHQNMKM